MFITASVTLVGFGLVVGLGPHGVGSAPRIVTDALSSCALAREVLGDHPSAVWFSGRANRAFGSNRDPKDRSNTPPGHEGWAYGSYAVSGSRASERFEYMAYFRQWNLGHWPSDLESCRADG